MYVLNIFSIFRERERERERGAERGGERGSIKYIPQTGTAADHVPSLRHIRVTAPSREAPVAHPKPAEVAVPSLDKCLIPDTGVLRVSHPTVIDNS